MATKLPDDDDRIETDLDLGFKLLAGVGFLLLLLATYLVIWPRIG